MSEIIISSYSELIGTIESICAKKIYKLDNEIRKRFFRGHANKEWKLIPNLLRDKSIQENSELINILKNDPKKSKKTLVVAQHYGQKTRCLDFTRNFKVALYFACNPNDTDYNQDGALFILEETCHKPDWFTNYLMYYTAIDSRNDISSWDFSNYLIQKDEIKKEFSRTGRSFEKGEVNSEIQTYLSKGFMIDFENNDYDFERIKKQEAALYYFGSKYYYIEEQKKVYANVDYISTHWSSQNMFRIELHNLSNPNLESNPYCTKIIIPQRLKKEIFEKINIKASDLGF